MVVSQVDGELLDEEGECVLQIGLMFLAELWRFIHGFGVD